MSDTNNPIVNGVAATSSDRDDRQRSEEALRRSEQRYRALVEASNQVVWSWTPAEFIGDFDRTQEWWGELTGQSIEEQRESHTAWLAVVHPDDREAADAAWGAALETGAPYDAEYRVRAREGGWRYIKARGIPIPGPDGSPQEWVGTLLDVTEQRRAEDARRESEERLHVALRAGRMGTWDLDLATLHMTCSDSCKANYGRGPGESFTYEDLAAAVHEDDRERWRTAVEDAIARSGEFDVEYRTRWPDGATHWVHVRGNCTTGAGGRALSGVSLDITNRKRAEELLWTSEEQRRLALDSAGLGSWHVDPDGMALSTDERFRAIFGVTDGELGYEEAVARIHPEDQDRVREAVAAAIRPDDPVPYGIEYRIALPDGGARWVFAKGRPNFEGTGANRRMVSFDGTLADITDRVLAERAMQSGQERLRTALVAARMVAWEWTPADRVLRVSENAADVFGLSPGVGLTGIDQGLALVHPDDVEGYKATFRRAIDERGSYRTQYRLVRPADGRVIWIEEQGHAVYDQPGGEVRLYGVAADVTARREAEELVRAGEEKYRTLFETIDEGFCVIEFLDGPHGLLSDYVHVEANPAYATNTGIPDIVGQKVREMVPDEAAAWVEIYRNVLVTGRPIRFERELVATGRHLNLAAFRIEPPERRQVAVLFNDVTTRKRAEEELRRIAAELSDADRRKDEFLATLAHELRNPLAPIRNGLQVLTMSDRPEARERAVAMMGRQLGQMVRLVDDLMDVSRVSRGKLELKRERVPLADVLGSAVETSRPLIDQMGHELTYVLPDRGVVVDADLTRLAQVFLNLLNNAAKYMDRGGRIWLTAERVGSEVAVSVRDTGIGIAADQLPRIFDLFSQVDRSLEKAQGGLGIGLTLVRRLTEMHGGTIEARSGGPGRGSEFVVRLPAVEAAVPAAVLREERITSTARRILIVDDNRDGADSLAEMMAIFGNETRTAYDGEVAVAVAVEFRPEVILLDIGLPKLNGYEACRRIRAHKFGTRPLIIAQTGWGADEDRQRTREAGFDHHMVKPVDPSALLTLLADAPV